MSILGIEKKFLVQNDLQKRLKATKNIQLINHILPFNPVHKFT